MKAAMEATMRTAALVAQTAAAVRNDSANGRAQPAATVCATGASGGGASGRRTTTRRPLGELRV